MTEWVIVSMMLHVQFAQLTSQDEEWTEEEKANQGFKADEFAFLSDMLGPRGMAFDNDDALEENDDEDLKNDPVSTMDMQVRDTLQPPFRAKSACS